jgi:hypothetical protein
VLRPLDQAGRLTGPFKGAVAEAEQAAAICRGAEKAVADPGSALQFPIDVRRAVLAEATYALARQEKQPARAAAAADLLAANAQGPRDLYGAACGYALCVPLADRPEAGERYAARAVELLRQAVAKGFGDQALMKKDADLDALRPRDDFRKVLADVEAAAAKGTKPK